MMKVLVRSIYRGTTRSAAYFPRLILIATNVLNSEVSYLLIDVDLGHDSWLSGAPLATELPARVLADPITCYLIRVVVVPYGTNVH